MFKVSTFIKMFDLLVVVDASVDGRFVGDGGGAMMQGLVQIMNTKVFDNKPGELLYI